MIRIWLTIVLSIPMMLQGVVEWHVTEPGGFSVTVSIPKPEIDLTDHLQINLTLNFPENYSVDHEALKANLLTHMPVKTAPFALLSADSDSHKNSDGSVSEKIQFKLQPVLAGDFHLSFFEIFFHPKNGTTSKQVQLISNLMNVKVSLPAIDPTPPPISRRVLLSLSPTLPIEMNDENRRRLLEDEALIAAESQRNQVIAAEESFPWLELVLMLLVGVFLFIAWRVPYVSLMPAETAGQRAVRARAEALQKLEEIQKKQPSPEQYYVELTDAVRKYLEERYQVQAPTSTTQEFLKDMKNYPLFSTDTRTELAQFLVNADNVKFAKYQPSLQERDLAQQSAMRVVSE